MRGCRQLLLDRLQFLLEPLTRLYKLYFPYLFLILQTLFQTVQIGVGRFANRYSRFTRRDLTPLHFGFGPLSCCLLQFFNLVASLFLVLALPSKFLS